jgi:hypothetical protein
MILRRGAPNLFSNFSDYSETCQLIFNSSILKETLQGYIYYRSRIVVISVFIISLICPLDASDALDDNSTVMLSVQNPPNIIGDNRRRGFVQMMFNCPAGRTHSAGCEVNLPR